MMSATEPPRPHLDPENSKELYVEIWKTAVDTQMHFNEMSGKARQFGLTFVAAALGLGIVLLSRGQEFAMVVSWPGGFNLHATVLIVLASACALYAVRVLDLNVYHKMLRGAVTFGEDFEQTYMREIFDLEKGMTQAISHFSRFEDASVVLQNGKYSVPRREPQERGAKNQAVLQVFDYVFGGRGRSSISDNRSLRSPSWRMTCRSH